VRLCGTHVSRAYLRNSQGDDGRVAVAVTKTS